MEKVNTRRCVNWRFATENCQNVRWYTCYKNYRLASLCSLDFIVLRDAKTNSLTNFKPFHPRWKLEQNCINKLHALRTFKCFSKKLSSLFVRTKLRETQWECHALIFWRVFLGSFWAHSGHLFDQICNSITCQWLELERCSNNLRIWQNI